MKNKQPDLSSLDYLETPLPDKSEAAADISLLQTAAAYHINLDDLERIMPEAGGDNDNLPVAAEPVETPSAPPRKEEAAHEETSFVSVRRGGSVCHGKFRRQFSDRRKSLRPS